MNSAGSCLSCARASRVSFGIALAIRFEYVELFKIQPLPRELTDKLRRSGDRRSCGSLRNRAECAAFRPRPAEVFMIRRRIPEEVGELRRQLAGVQRFGRRRLALFQQQQKLRRGQDHQQRVLDAFLEAASRQPTTSGRPPSATPPPAAVTGRRKAWVAKRLMISRAYVGGSFLCSESMKMFLCDGGGQDVVIRSFEFH